MGGGPASGKNPLLDLDDPTAVVESDDLDDEVEDRPTVRPDFDLSELVAKTKVRERMATITDDSALEQARLASVPSSMPPAREPPDSIVEIAMGEADIEALGPAEQVALLRARLGPLSRAPTLAKKLTELGETLKDPKTAYVLGFVDGVLPLETIIDVTGLSELETLRILDRVASAGLFLYGKKP